MLFSGETITLLRRFSGAEKIMTIAKIGINQGLRSAVPVWPDHPLAMPQSKTALPQ